MRRVEVRGLGERVAGVVIALLFAATAGGAIVLLVGFISRGVSG